VTRDTTHEGSVRGAPLLRLLLPFLPPAVCVGCMVVSGAPEEAAASCLGSHSELGLV
jgi:hypothetical protein